MLIEFYQEMKAEHSLLTFLNQEVKFFINKLIIHTNILGRNI